MKNLLATAAVCLLLVSTANGLSIRPIDKPWVPGKKCTEGYRMAINNATGARVCRPIGPTMKCGTGYVRYGTKCLKK